MVDDGGPLGFVELVAVGLATRDPGLLDGADDVLKWTLRLHMQPGQTPGAALVLDEEVHHGVGLHAPELLAVHHPVGGYSLSRPSLEGMGLLAGGTRPVLGLLGFELLHVSLLGLALPLIVPVPVPGEGVDLATPLGVDLRRRRDE